MTTINFPASPSVGTIYTFQDRSWIWNGRAWQSKSIFVGYTGFQGEAGTDGADGGLYTWNEDTTTWDVIPSVEE